MSPTSPFRDHACTRLARGFLSGGFFVVYGLLSILFGSLLFPILLCVGSGAHARRAMRGLIRAGYRVFVAAAEGLRLIRVEISPADCATLLATRGSIVIANHLTLIDIVILLSIIPDATCVAKGAAARNFFMGRIIRSAFLVNDDDPVKLLGEATALLHRGASIVVFPEGTRMPPDGRPHKLRRGAAHLALASGAPIRPVTIACDPLVLAKHQPWYDIADRVIVYHFRVQDAILPAARPSQDAASGIPNGACSHHAAVALTAEISHRLFGGIS